MAYETYKNSIIESGPYAGETELGVDFFTGEELLPADTLIKKTFSCDRCGRPAEVELCKQKGRHICARCMDQSAPKKRSK
jgi:formamidopyrimidine-DNA glycosylase